MRKKLKKILTSIVLGMILFVSACGSKSDPGEYEFDKLGGGGNEDVEVLSIDTTATQTSVSDAISMLTSNLTTEQSKVSSESFETYSFNDDSYQITSSGSYYFSGNIDSPIIIAENLGEVHLYLENADISVDSNKVIDAKSGSNLIITLLGNNVITNTGDSKNAISCSNNLTINGNGVLTITSTKSAIKADGVFFGLGGNLSINSGAHGISADTVYLNGIKMIVNSCEKDAVHAESEYDELLYGEDSIPEYSYSKGFVFIDGSTNIDVQNCKGDGIQGDSFVYIKDGTINIETLAQWEQITASENGLSGCYNYSNGTYSKVAKESVVKGSTYYVLKESVKCIKVGEIDYTYVDENENEISEGDVVSDKYLIFIEGGSFNLSSADDGVHSNSGDILIKDGTFIISTLDDSICADVNVVISGGDITISQSYEAIEGQSIEIAGGNIVLTASDDGINASNSNISDSEEKNVCSILISGGKTYVNASGDGIDSNGGILITGGELYVYGPSSGADASLDSENGIEINGGIVIAVGSSGMVETPSTNSSQNCLVMNLSSSKTGSVSIVSGTTTLATFDPISIWGTTKNYSSVLISLSNFVAGDTYSVTTGSSSTSVTLNSSSTITKSGQTVGPKR